MFDYVRVEVNFKFWKEKLDKYESENRSFCLIKYVAKNQFNYFPSISLKNFKFKLNNNRILNN